MWKEVLDFDLQARRPGTPTPVKELVAGKTFHRRVGGFVARRQRRARSRTGSATTWRWRTSTASAASRGIRISSARAIAEEWTKLTFGHDPAVVETVVDLQLRSWPTYEDYTGPLGAGTLTDIIQVHYGPAPAVVGGERLGAVAPRRRARRRHGSHRRHRHRLHRPVPPGRRRRLFESLATCPEELLLFMHHVPYTHRLRSGTTVIQHIYDRHFAGAAEAADFVRRWGALAGRIDEPRFNDVLKRLDLSGGSRRGVARRRRHVLLPASRASPTRRDASARARVPAASRRRACSCRATRPST